MTIRIGGVDIGFTKESPTALAVVEFSPKPVLIYHALFYPQPKRTQWDMATVDIGQQLQKGIEGKLLDLIAYELPHVRSNVQTAIKLAHLCGIVQWIARASYIHAQGVQPAQAKLALTKSGSATKRQMQASAYALFGKRLSEHEADACGIALAGALLAQVIA